jgi:hypothetical protein
MRERRLCARLWGYGGAAIGLPPHGSGREGEPVRRLDVDHGGDDRLLELEVAVPEEGFDRLDVETAGDLFGRRHRESPDRFPSATSSSARSRAKAVLSLKLALNHNPTRI